jgi:hypothetical protein
MNEKRQEKIMQKKWSNTKRSNEGKNFVTASRNSVVLKNNEVSTREAALKY